MNWGGQPDRESPQRAPGGAERGYVPLAHREAGATHVMRQDAQDTIF